MFGGINIDPQQMMQMQQNVEMCTSHPECVNCPLYSSTGYKGIICENALVKLAQGDKSNNAEQGDTNDQV